MSCFVAFHYKSYGTFCLYEKRLIISRVDLPTTEMIEPFLEFVKKGVMTVLIKLVA